MRATLDGATVKAGDALPAHEKTYTTVDLVAYGAATWDWHRLHYDLEYARSRQLPNVIIDGQMFGAVFARQAIDWAGPRSFVAGMNIRMRAMAFAGDTLRCEGQVSEVRAEAGYHVVMLAQRLVSGDRLCAESATTLHLPR